VYHPPFLNSEWLFAEEPMSDAPVTPPTASESKVFGKERLKPGAYTIDLSAAADRQVIVNGEPSTFLAAYYRLSGSKIQEIADRPLVGDVDEYIAEDGVLLLGGDWRLRSAMRTLIGFVGRGIPPGEVMWFYYDFDWSRDADVLHVFFAVHGGKVVLESCRFSAEEPLVIAPQHDDDPIWHTHPFFDEALERYWYQRFYSETLTGRLMVLRPDEPILFHYERPQTRDVVKNIELVTLIKAYRLLWVIVALLAAIAFPPLRESMGGVAVILIIDVLYRWWVTRKVGE
jgi:hypothetical protein